MAFVALGRCRIECDGLVPEHAEHLHAVAVVPNRRGHNAVGSGHPDHLPHRRGRVGHEVQHQHRQRPVECGVREGQRGSVADLEAHPVAIARPLRGPHELARRVNADHSHGRDGRGGERQRSRAAPHVEHIVAGLYSGEVHEQRRQSAAPPSHEPFVAIAFGEHAALRLSSFPWYE